MTKVTGGTHRCDGTNGAANPSAVPTPTAALDDAARKRHFTWGGTGYASFDRFSVDTVKNVAGGGPAYWNISVNGTSTPVGGCRFKLNAGGKVAFTWTAFSSRRRRRHRRTAGRPGGRPAHRAKSPPRTSHEGPSAT